MTRLEFLTKMENCLSKQLTKSEMSTIMRNLIDYFNDCERRGKRETQITKDLGDPQKVAMQMVARSRVMELIRHPSKIFAIAANHNSSDTHVCVVCTDRGCNFFCGFGNHCDYGHCIPTDAYFCLFIFVFWGHYTHWVCSDTFLYFIFYFQKSDLRCRTSVRKMVYPF